MKTLLLLLLSTTPAWGGEARTMLRGNHVTLTCRDDDTMRLTVYNDWVNSPGSYSETTVDCGLGEVHIGYNGSTNRKGADIRDTLEALGVPDGYIAVPPALLIPELQLGEIIIMPWSGM